MQRTIRNAEPTDFDAISNLDKEVIGTRLDRSGRIATAIAELGCNVMASGSNIQGFSIASPNAFRGMDFLDLVVVSPLNRRQGIATHLIAHFRETSKTPERWTSTNQSNQAMISLLRKLNWHESDHIEELDLGDPEMFFYINSAQSPHANLKD